MQLKELKEGFKKDGENTVLGLIKAYLVCFGIHGSEFLRNVTSTICDRDHGQGPYKLERTRQRNN